MKTKTNVSNYFSNFDLAGFTYYDGVEVFGELKIGVKLHLVVEPENRYDVKAVAIYYKDKKLGFVPRSHNREISKFLNLGYTDLFDVYINRVSSDEHTESQIGVVVKVRDRK